VGTSAAGAARENFPACKSPASNVHLLSTLAASTMRSMIANLSCESALKRERHQTSHPKPIRISNGPEKFASRQLAGGASAKFSAKRRFSECAAPTS
jgi:hypothetical protein